MAVTGRALVSRLELRFESGGDRITRLVERRTGGLCHIGKTYWNGDVLLTQLVNPTAGYFAGDSLEAVVTLGPEASVLLSNPSATRLHTMTDGAARMTQTFRLAAGSFLEIHPDLLIPQAGSSGSVSTRIEIEEDASLFYLDLLAPGRMAHGESLQWRDFTSGFDLIVDGVQVVRERARISPPAHDWKLRMPDGRPCYVATCWVRLPGAAEIMPKLLEEAETLVADAGVLGGSSWLGPGLGVIRCLTPESARLRRSCAMVREHFSSISPPLGARTGKL